MRHYKMQHMQGRHLLLARQLRKEEEGTRGGTVDLFGQRQFHGW